MGVAYLFINTCETVEVAWLEDGKVLAQRQSQQARAQVEELMPLVQAIREEVRAARAATPPATGDSGAAAAVAADTAPATADSPTTDSPATEPQDVDLPRPQAVIVSRGPAAFTGLRVGLVAARVLARAWQVPVYGVGQLELLATAAFLNDAAIAAALEAGQSLLVATDARRKEIYWQRFTLPPAPDNSTPPATRYFGPLVAARPAQVGSVTAALAESSGDHKTGSDQEEQVVIGSATALYPAELPPAAQLSLEACAGAAQHLVEATLAALGGEADAALHTEAQYLRRPDVQMPKGPKRVSA